MKQIENSDPKDRNFKKKAVYLNKPLPGPNDFGYKYDPQHQRDPFDPSKPLPR